MKPNFDKFSVLKTNTDRIPTLADAKEKPDDTKQKEHKIIMTSFDLSRYYPKKNNKYNNFASREDLCRRNTKRDKSIYSYCLLSVCISFLFGLIIGIVLMGSQSQLFTKTNLRRLKINETREILTRALNSIKQDIETESNITDKFKKVSFTGDAHKYNKDVYPKGLTEDMKDILKDNKDSRLKHTITNVINNKTIFVPQDDTVLYDNVFWGPEIENSMPQGYGQNTADIWERYVEQSEVIKMEEGCGRMQNRLVTFKDGVQACVRYRQNTDQIQGEIFSFYVARLLNLTNLAPSVVKVVDLKDNLWQNVANDIAIAQWNTNRPVVLTQYIPSLESATIPEIFKPANRHLNKIDVLNMSLKENETEESKEILIEKLKTKNFKMKKSEVAKFDHIDIRLNKKTVNSFVELAQWSDLIIFDFLTANLDRIVNNLFNYQWNVNIMDGPAHNLARKMDSGLLLFLDNESGLLHGYRLLKKYNVYHSLMLDNLCVFRRGTVDALRKLYKFSAIGSKLSNMFHEKNNAVIRDILPPLPEKNAKILHDRLGKVLSQVDKCQQNFSYR